MSNYNMEDGDMLTRRRVMGGKVDFNPVYIDGPAHGIGAKAFAGAVLAQNGEVILVPSSSNYIGIYDPSTNTYKYGPQIEKNSQTGKFYGGVLAPNGKIIFFPCLWNYIGIYDPATNTYTNGPMVTSGRYWDGVLLNNGNIALLPYGYDILIYNPVSNTLTSGPTVSGGRFCGGIALPPPSWLVVLVPGSNPAVGLYDSSTNQYKAGPPVGLPADDGRNGCYVSDECIIFAPYGRANMCIYNSITDTIINTASHGQGLNAFSGAVSVLDDYVILIPYDSANIGVYNTKRGSYEKWLPHGQAKGAFYNGCVLLEERKIVLCPFNSTKIGILTY